MFEYRVTKYDPRLRDADGCFRGEDWTSFSDIGKSFAGRELTADEYQRVEDAYVVTALAFLAESGGERLWIRALENRRGVTTTAITLAENAELDLLGIALVCRLNLREHLWCKLEDDAGRFLHFGYDYYLYVGVPTPCEGARRLTEERGLFVEPMTSPYTAP